MKNTGLILSPVNPNDAIADDLILSAGEELPKDEVIEVEDWAKKLPFKKDIQGATPYCVTFDYLYRLQAKIYFEKDEVIDLSEKELGTNSGTSKNGNYAYIVADEGRRKGVVTEETCPYPDVDNWNWNDWDKLTTLNIPKDAIRYFGGNYISIMPYNIALIKQELLKRPLGVAIPLWGSTWNGPVHEVVKNGTGNPNSYHMATITGVRKDGVWIIEDSLRPQKRLLAPDYQFNYVQYLGDLPENWKTEQKKPLIEEYDKCIKDHYNQTRLPWYKEQEVALKMRKAFEKYSNPIVRSVAGRFWLLYVNAVLYGGYNYEYYKWGKWYPGDVINDAYYYSKHQKHIFNFNKLRKEH